MSNFIHGGGTLKSTSYPAAFVELACLLNAAEQAASTIDNPINNLAISFDAEALSAAITATVPITAGVDGAGNLVTQASQYVPTVNFNPGTNGTLNALSLPGAFLEMAQRLNVEEQNASSPDNPVSNITIAFDLETLSATITAALPMAVKIDDFGQVVIVPEDYLPINL